MAASVAGVAKTYRHEDIVRSKSDKRIYRGLELDNGMKVLLVSDPETDQSSVAIDVNAGHMNNSRELPGLAQLCEQVVSRGTVGFPCSTGDPKESGIRTFLSKHGGWLNSETTEEHTNFHCAVSPGHLRDTVARLVEVVTCPTFEKDDIEREVSCMENEHFLNLHKDDRRLHELRKSLANPDSNLSICGYVNGQSLGSKKENINKVKEELENFHKKFYSAEDMGCCVVGRESVETMEEMLVPLLMSVENTTKRPMETPKDPYTKNELQRVVMVVPVKQILRKVSIEWQTPYMDENVGLFFRHLIGHRGAGSLQSELKSKGWALKLTTRESSLAKNKSYFSIDVEATEEVIKNINDIITLVYQHIYTVKKENRHVKEEIFKNCKELASMRFHFKEKESPVDYTRELSRKLNDISPKQDEDCPMKDILTADYLLGHFNSELIDSVMKALEPENMTVTVVSKDFKGYTEETENWYGTKYALMPFSSDEIRDFLSQSSHNSQLPEKSQYDNLIPTEEFLSSFVNDSTPAKEDERRDASFPKKIKYTPYFTIWHKKDTAFGTCEAFVNLKFTSDLAYQFSDDIVEGFNILCPLLCQLVNDSLDEYAYMAERAGLRCRLENTEDGMSLSVGGFSEHLETFLDKIMDTMISTFESLKNRAMDQTRFMILKQACAAHLRNSAIEKQYAPGEWENYVANYDYESETLNTLKMEEMAEFMNLFFESMHIEGLIYGNILQSKSESLIDNVEKQISKIQRSTEPVIRPEMRPAQPSQHKRSIIRKKCMVNHQCGIDVYYECGRCDQKSIPNRIILDLFVEIIKEPCRSYLRTEKQLSVVECGIRRSNGIQSLYISIQSPKNAADLDIEVSNFIVNRVNDVINNLSLEDFSAHKTALINKKLAYPRAASQQNHRYWEQILAGCSDASKYDRNDGGYSFAGISDSSGGYHFGRDANEAWLLRAVSKSDVDEFYGALVNGGAKVSTYVKKATNIPPGHVEGDK